MPSLLLAIIEQITANPNLLVGLAAAIVGGVGVKTLEYFTSRQESEVDEATKLRAELRAEAERRKEDVERLSAELEDTKERLFDLQSLKAELEFKNQQLEMIIERLQSQN